MKQSKKLTYYNKRAVSKAGLDPTEWRLLTENKETLSIIHKGTGEIRDIQKEG